MIPMLLLTAICQVPSPQGAYGFSAPPPTPAITSMTVPVEVRYRPTWRLRSPLERGLKPVLASPAVWTTPAAVFAAAPAPAPFLAAPVKAAPQSLQAASSSSSDSSEILSAIRKINDRLDRLEAGRDPWKASAPPIPSP